MGQEHNHIYFQKIVINQPKKYISITLLSSEMKRCTSILGGIINQHKRIRRTARIWKNRSTLDIYFVDIKNLWQNKVIKCHSSNRRNSHTKENNTTYQKTQHHQRNTYQRTRSYTRNIGIKQIEL